MRILLVHNRYRQAGGEDAVVEAEAAVLENGGHTVHVLRVDNPAGAAAAGVALAKAPWNRAAATAVVETAKSNEADVVHVHNTWFSLSPAVFPALKAAGVPVVATVHNYRPACVNALLYRDGRICEDCLGRLPWRGVAHACYRDSRLQSAAVAVTITGQRWRRTWERDVDAVIALTEFMAGKLESSGIPGDRIVVKPNFVPDPGERSRVPSASREVLYVGRLTEDKGVLDLVGAWEDSSAPLDLVVIGDGPLMAEVVAASGPRVSVLGSRGGPEIRRRMLAARALVIPSRWYEGLPMVLLEALAAGLPVVVPDHGALLEAAGEAGLAFASGDPLSLAAEISRLSSDATVERCGAAARERYLEVFTPEIGLARLEEIYARVLPDKGRAT